jgi:hypothetical protein
MNNALHRAIRQQRKQASFWQISCHTTPYGAVQLLAPF